MNHFAGFLVAATTLAAGIPTALAQLAKDGTFDFTICVTGNAKAISFDDQHRAFAWVEEEGFAHGAPPGGLFDMTLFRCVGSGGVIEGTRSITDHCEVADRDGDTMFLVHHYEIDLATGSRESGVKILAGTGKYDGISGTGDSQPPVSIPVTDPERPGLYAPCVQINGEYKIP